MGNREQGESSSKSKEHAEARITSTTSLAHKEKGLGREKGNYHLKQR